MQTMLSWSGGKDATYALDRLRRGDEHEVVELLTTVAEETGRTSTHGVRPALMERQAAALSLPIHFVEVPAGHSGEYGDRVAEAEAAAAERGVEAVAYADLFLEDIREWREQRLADGPLTGLWPVWGTDTAELSRDFRERGYRAVVVCVDSDDLDPSFVGREYDDAFLADLPDDVDPAGENGEFHTFVYDGPIFDDPVAFERGERCSRERDLGTYHYCDLRPV